MYSLSQGGGTAGGQHQIPDYTLSTHITYLLKKAQQRLFFIRMLKSIGLSPQLLTSLYRATIESLHCLSATVWYGSCTAQDRDNLAHVGKPTQGIVGTPLPYLGSRNDSRV